MATYTELFDFKADPDGTAFRNKVSVAVTKKAQALIDGATPTAAEIAWADAAIKAPLSKSNELVNYVLAANSTASIAVITAATDATIQTNVDAAVDALIAGGA